jgi:hypothetical protein
VVGAGIQQHYSNGGAGSDRMLVWHSEQGDWPAGPNQYLNSENSKTIWTEFKFRKYGAEGLQNKEQLSLLELI